MSTAEKLDFHSVESYLEFLDKSEFPYEYVDGYLRAMSAPTVRHNMVASNALIAFGAKLKGRDSFPFLRFQLLQSAGN